MHDPGDRWSEGRGGGRCRSARGSYRECRRGSDGFDGSDGLDGSAGLGARLATARSGLASVVADLDPARLTGADAIGLYESLVAVERLVVAGKTLLAPGSRPRGCGGTVGTARPR